MINNFLIDTVRGLSASPKYLKSKYFYNEAGDALFKEIMESPEYYLTKCELDIFSNQSEGLTDSIVKYFEEFDLVELGAGDASKTSFLLAALQKRKTAFTYYPIDISSNIIANLKKNIPETIPGINIHGLNGEYFAMLATLKRISNRNKIVLFLGSSIGNIQFDETVGFFSALREHLVPGDLVLTGFDLKKDPSLILSAYNDKAGITRRFNLNLLERINTELCANFDLNQFEHRPQYSQETGACKSFLQSTCEQTVQIGTETEVHFKAGEQIFMEISQKYTAEQTDEIASAAGFRVVQHFYDSQKWFLDALWVSC